MSNSKLLSLSLFISFALSTLMLNGCIPSSTSGSVYSRDQARTSQSVYYGTLLRVEQVTIEGTQTGAGTVAGGAMGGVLGNAVGSGSGRAIATVGGAILGAVTGSAAEKGITNAVGLELEVELDNGELVLIVQEKDGIYRVGDRVRVVKDARGTSRVRQ
ncbi:MAG: glycine zipper 2TM domain-containing protein [Desulfuromonadales bacterium]